MPDEQAGILKANEVYLASADGRRAMIAWLVEDNRGKLPSEILEALPILKLADLFARQQYLAEVLARPANDIDIPLLGRIASEYVAARAIQAERGRSGGSARKLKKGIWAATLILLRDPGVTTARAAFRRVLEMTRSGVPMRVEGWEVTATSPGPNRQAEDKVCQRNLETGKNKAEITYRSFETGYWSRAKSEAPAA